MLTLNLQRVFKLKGIDDATAYMRKLGYKRTKAFNLINDKKSTVEFDDLEFLCKRLNCTPNDLLEWTPSKDDSDMPISHALHAIRRKDAAIGLVTLVENLPLEQMEEVERFILERTKR
ncbi:helix-turn-helix transcriptional regulator [uncultured Acetobacteroides sp.]|uniref:helix-turn-helix domain-containing protein n=1 Tax=uncultured Acetobacteroides sp. TaxID=1760811 RepID=UPI0029F599E0|nr:helix-turn-helix transcriptional regulator [uncultured Acetobacteroides sp.]